MNAPKNSRTIARDSKVNRKGFKGHLMQGQPYGLPYRPEKKHESSSKYSPKECAKDGKR